jgi:hypothetical protein
MFPAQTAELARGLRLQRLASITKENPGLGSFLCLKNLGIANVFPDRDLD